MTDAEKHLLLMVAKDMRRLWSNSPHAFGDNWAISNNKPRVDQYDHEIFEVEHGEGSEANAEDCEGDLGSLGRD